jgi:phage baseplate assembly protein W
LARFRRKSIIINEPSSSVNYYTNPIGVTIPFNNPNGIFFQSYTNRVQVFSNVKNLLLTAKGERYELPDFGTELRFILFENITEENDFVERIRGEIISAITTWIPYVTITKLDVNLNLTEDGRVIDSNHAVGIVLELKITGTNIYLPIQIFISDTGNLRIQEAQN